MLGRRPDPNVRDVSQGPAADHLAFVSTLNMYKTSRLLFLVATAIFVLRPVHAETELPWTNLRLKTQQGGNAEIRMTRSFAGHLLVALVYIHSASEPVSIPKGCWPLERPVYFDNVRIHHGLTDDDRGYWKFSFDVHEESSANGRARYSLIVDSKRIRSSYLAYVDSATEVNRVQLCPPKT